MEMPIVVGELPQDSSAKTSASPKAATGNKLGLVVEDLTAEQRQQLSLKNEGVVITRVDGTAARRAALQPGDIILMVGRKPVTSSSDFSASVNSSKPGIRSCC